LISQVQLYTNPPGATHFVSNCTLNEAQHNTTCGRSRIFRGGCGRVWEPDENWGGLRSQENFMHL